MNTSHLKITSPDGVLFADDITAFFVRSSDGDMAVLAGHAPFVGTVQPCACRVAYEDAPDKSGRTSGGLLKVDQNGTVLFTASVEWDD